MTIGDFFFWSFVVLCIVFNIAYNALVIDEAKNSESHNGKTRLAFAIMNMLLMFILIIWFIIQHLNSIKSSVAEVAANLSRRLSQNQTNAGAAVTGIEGARSFNQFMGLLR